MMNCHEASRLASSQLDEPLPLTKRIALSIHLMMCRHCRRFARQTERLRRIAAITQIDTGVRLSDDARARIRSVLQTQAHVMGGQIPRADE